MDDLRRAAGRALCKAGLHKWRPITKPDHLNTMTRYVTLNYCERPDCLEPIHVVDIEYVPHANYRSILEEAARR